MYILTVIISGPIRCHNSPEVMNTVTDILLHVFIIFVSVSWGKEFNFSAMESFSGRDQITSTIWEKLTVWRHAWRKLWTRWRRQGNAT